MASKVIDYTFATFSPREYLNHYYLKIDHENENLLKFFAEVNKNIPKEALMLEFGGGPTIYQLISAAKKVKEIHFSDYLEKNLDEIKLWQKADKKAFNWDSYFKKALSLEGKKTISKEQIEKRKNLLKRKIVKYIKCDAFKSKPLGYEVKQYDIVSVNFVPEGITDSKEKWKLAIKNISSLLKNGGIFLMAAVKEATHWKTGNKAFPAVNINENDVKSALEKLKYSHISIYSIEAEVIEENLENYSGYKGIMFIKAIK